MIRPSPPEQDRTKFNMGAVIVLGAGFGAVVGAFADHVAVGVATGTVIGAALAAILNARRGRPDEAPRGNGDE